MDGGISYDPAVRRDRKPVITSKNLFRKAGSLAGSVVRQSRSTEISDNGAHAHSKVKESLQSYNYQPSLSWASLEWNVLNHFSSAVTCFKANSWLDRVWIKSDFLKWIVLFFIGIFTGVVGFYIDGISDLITVSKYNYIKSYTSHPFSSENFAIVCCFFIFLNAGLVTVATLLTTLFEPCAAGSGIPEIKCVLNGVKLPRVLRFRTLVVKATGVLFSVASNLPIGKEGPMIHSGAVCGAGLGKGRGFIFKNDNWLAKRMRRFQNDDSAKMFISSGASAVTPILGVAAAFGAPLGGTLFSIEEGSSFITQNLVWSNFFCAMISFVCISTLRSGGIGGLMDVSWFNLGGPYFAVFGSLEDHGTYSFTELFFFCILGIIMGFIGAAFNQASCIITQWRQKYVTTKTAKALQAIAISFLCSVIWVLVPQAIGLQASSTCTIPDGSTVSCSVQCKPLGSYLIPQRSNPALSKFTQQFFCPENHYHEAASLFFNSSYNIIRLLFHSDSDHNFMTSNLFLFAFVYLSLAVITYGIAVPSGLFVPSIIAGAIVGRLFGQGMQIVFYWRVTPTFPGLYAAAGSAAMLGGMARITISAVVIIAEATKSLEVTPLLMLPIMFAKWVGDLFNEGLYDIHIHLDGVPRLEYEPPVEAQFLVARELQAVKKTKEMTVLPVIVRVRALVDFMRDTLHQGFPIVPLSVSEAPAKISDPRILDGGLSYVGYMHTQDLCGLLQLRQFLLTKPRAPAFQNFALVSDGVEHRHNQENSFGQQYSDIMGLTFFRHEIPTDLSEMDLDKWIDLSPFMNQSPMILSDVAPAARVFNMFRTLGLRHLLLVNCDNRVTGMITRKDLLEENIEAALEHDDASLDGRKSLVRRTKLLGQSGAGFSVPFISVGGSSVNGGN